MFKNKSFVLLILLFTQAKAVWAVTEADIWVPKRFTVAKHKLLSTAVEAERTDRCQRVIQGQISVEKTTKDAYYFIITCRDKRSVSYNLSYSYPVNGAEPILLNEQKVVMPDQEDVIEDVPTITADEAWPLCLADLKSKTKTMLEVSMVEDNPRAGSPGEQLQVFTIPFDAKNPEGSLLRYEANCQVDVDKNLSLKIAPRRPAGS